MVCWEAAPLEGSVAAVVTAPVVSAGAGFTVAVVVVLAPQSPKAWSLTKNREASSEPQADCWAPPTAVMVCWEAAPAEGSVAATPVVPAGTPAVVAPAPQSPKAWSLTKNRDASSEPQAFCWNPPMAVMVCCEAEPCSGAVAAVVTAPVVSAGAGVAVAVVVVLAPQSPKAWSLTKNREASSEPQADCWAPPTAVMVCWEAAPAEGSVLATPVVPAGTPAVVALAPQSPKAWSLTKNREASSELQAFCWNPPMAVMVCCEAEPCSGAVAAVVTTPVLAAGAELEAGVTDVDPGAAAAVVVLAPQSPKAWSLTKNRDASSELQAFCWNPPMAVMVCCEAEPCWGAVTASVATAPELAAGVELDVVAGVELEAGIIGP